MKRDKNKFDSIKIYLGSTSPFQNMVSHLEQITRINLILPSNANLYPPLNDISRLPNNTAISSLKFNRARAISGQEFVQWRANFGRSLRSDEKKIESVA